MPYLDSNIPSKVFYASVGSEILRIARIDLINMVTRDDLLLIRMKKQGSEVFISCHYWKRSFG